MNPVTNDCTDDSVNIFEDTCKEYVKWTKTTKQKLKERERQSMFVRVTTLQSVINAECEHFENVNSHLNPNNNNTLNYSNILRNTNIITDCLNKLYLLLSTWTGVNVIKTKQSLTTFRKYFGIGKCWFDYRKQSTIATEFWIKYFLILETFTINSANIYFKSKYKELQILYSKHLLFKFITGILNTEIQFESTKLQPIIPSRIIKDSVPMKIYFTNLHHTLNIDRIITENSTTLNAKQLINLVCKQLKYLTNKFHIEFQNKFKQIYIKKSETIKTVKNTFNNAFAELSNENENKNNSELILSTSISPTSVSNHNNNNNNNNYNSPPQTVFSETYNINNYNNNHSSSQTVFSQRYNPFSLNAYSNYNNNISNNNTFHHCRNCCQSCNYCCYCCPSLY